MDASRRQHGAYSTSQLRLVDSFIMFDWHACCHLRKATTPLSMLDQGFLADKRQVVLLAGNNGVVAATPRVVRRVKNELSATAHATTKPVEDTRR